MTEAKAHIAVMAVQWEQTTKKKPKPVEVETSQNDAEEVKKEIKVVKTPKISDTERLSKVLKSVNLAKNTKNKRES